MQFPAPPRRYIFQDFLLDVDGGFLRRQGEEVPLQPKAFEVLCCLVERHGRLVSREELIDTVWPKTAVTDNSLAQCLVQIRRALADDSQQMVRTVARRGYVFAVPVTIPLPAGHSLAETPSATRPAPVVPRPKNQLWRLVPLLIVGTLAVVGAWTLLNRRLPPSSKPDIRFTRLTNFPDFASGPTLSRDGRMVAFFRSPSPFATDGPIYVKSLPNGEPVMIAEDKHNKYGLAFSFDGSQVTYTGWENTPNSQWKTFAVSLPGGAPHLMFANAAGLSWLDERNLLYSEIRTGLHMGIVTSALNRTQRREIYFPEYERRMAHYSYRSPDGKWLLAAEMEPRWIPCRLLPFDGSSSGRQVGPDGACTAAGWSPDGKWMYFGAEVNGEKHLWRQAFPDGKPEQLTFGPAEEEGLAVAPDGSLVTSIGIRQSAVMVHDAGGERAISPEGFASANYLVLTAPLFSADGRKLYHLLARDKPGTFNELWRTDIASRTSERIVGGFPILEFDIARDEDANGEVVFSAQEPGKPSEIWIALLDRSTPPRRIGMAGDASPRFGPDGTIWYRYSDGKANYAGLMNKDGAGRHQAAPYPVSTLMKASPGGRWLIAMAPAPGRSGIDTIAIPAAGGAPRIIGPGRWPVSWDRAGSTCYIGLNTRSSLAIPVSRGELPKEPPGGFQAWAKNPPRGFDATPIYEISPGPDPETFAYVKTTQHRNLFRLSW